MCEVCDIKKRVILRNEELEFRLEQYQKEKRFGNIGSAQDARSNAFESLKALFLELDQHHEAVIRREKDESASGLGESLANLFGQKLN